MTYGALKPTLLLLLAVASACGGSERSFVGGDGGHAGGQGGSGGSTDGGKRDGSADGAGTGGTRMDAGADHAVTDATADVEEMGPPPPPPPPGRPGISIVAGGAKMASPSYKAVVVTSESPGGNGVMSSPSYKLHGGVIGTTQPK